MRRGLAGALMLAALAGCAAERPPLPDPAAIAPHEWAHGPPWGPGEPPRVALPAYALGPAYGPGYWGPSIGLGFGIGRGWRGHGWGRHPGYIHRPPGGFHRGGRGGRR